jgi:hypothetical protein
VRPIRTLQGRFLGFHVSREKNHIRKQGMQVEGSISVFLTRLQSVKGKICSRSVVIFIRPRGRRVPRIQFIKAPNEISNTTLWERVRTAIFLALVSFDAFSSLGHTRRLSLALRIWLFSLNNTQVVGGRSIITVSLILDKARI